MPQYPRRTLLGGIGTTMALGLAGTTASSTAANGTRDSADAPSFDTLLDRLPASVAADQLTMSVMDLERRREANEPYGPNATTGAFEIDDETVAKQATVYATGDEFTQSVTVLTGEIDLDGDGESRETDDGIAYDRYEAGEQVAAVTDEAVVIAQEAAVLSDAVAAGAGDADRLLDSMPLLAEAFDSYEDADGYSVSVGDDFQPPEIDATAEYVVRAMTVLGPDTMAMDFGVSFTDADDVTDELVERLEGEFAYMATTNEPTTEVDGSLVTITVERDLAAERAAQEHDSPGALHVARDLDLDDDLLEIEIGHGDPTPIEDLTLEVGDEEYDRDVWTNGHGTLEEGDTIVIETDDVEPNCSVTLTHDHEYGSSSSSTTLLSHFRFEFAYDPDATELTVEYADEFPLDGDEVWLAVHEDRPTYGFRGDDAEPTATAQPWTGTTMESGDDATIADVDPGDVVSVCWGEPSFRESLSTHRAQPPGTVVFEYDYEEQSLAATLELDDDTERSASAYELLIDGEPADTQWADAADTVASGTTIEVDAVPVGADVEVVWGEDDVRVGSAYPQPTIDLAFTDDGTAVEHVGGDSVDASALEARVWTEGDNVEIDLADEIDGDFEKGDTIPVDASATHGLSLIYEGQYHIGYAHTA
ncbi:hypothetical protein C488_02645 [Natrinema pellirubrum DSM 15624]|uniref:Uncharacterized protein n=1 Tax=Natrinema pellirubrum (strain DSM 15624 / CIP 106293 / JCM 10476 / NCIMB 786 / 157) TaxID=797303 RepID=L0JKT1_NATP1|nr:hypothetical protein [Natrinema pellirubrum]AGB30966.1 hypothetical protein Natpe_1054 [Natrinema pellirubrum DSM 15624]ELY80651.1 hypothetical protein C488_02645 [Natrinema pellirubrum DSM 15624]